MSAPHAGSEAEWPHDGSQAKADAEFVRNLHEGSDQLAAGDVPAARSALERAIELRPKDPKARGLLGLCYFKLGLFDEADALYSELVRENPFDVTLHVNLGLVQLKSGRHDAAIRTLEVATGLSPEHRRAQNYLGLAYAQSGNPVKAREAFLRAGSAAQVLEMDRLIAEAQGGSRAQTAPFLAAAPAERPDAGGAEAPEGQDAPSLAELTRAVRLFWPRGSPFAVDEGGVAIDFSAGIHTRVDGLVAARGDTGWVPMRKRFAGRVIDRSFGTGARQMWHATGGGQLLVSSRIDGEARCFTAIRLEEDAYLVEDRLFAFEESIDAENGRVPGRGLDLPLVRLRGSGHLLVVSERPLRSEPIFGNESLQVPRTGLVGWTGPLTPRLLAMFDGPEGTWVELTGQGDVLVLG
ncbi:MAG TPA: tetratricopeptide repeat protein [Vulgatibacter sp.]|nr:tetratricopeptide repeat protein [Vulgatibacter sp.]